MVTVAASVLLNRLLADDAVVLSAVAGDDPNDHLITRIIR
jgi:hypothetical protein